MYSKSIIKCCYNCYFMFSFYSWTDLDFQNILFLYAISVLKHNQFYRWKPNFMYFSDHWLVDQPQDRLYNCTKNQSTSSQVGKDGAHRARFEKWKWLLTGDFPLCIGMSTGWTMSLISNSTDQTLVPLFRTWFLLSHLGSTYTPPVVMVVLAY